MIQLAVTVGDRAAEAILVDKFPITVGRAPGNSFVLCAPGVFSEHFQVAFTPDGFLLSSRADAAITVNEETSAGGILRNGDVIGAGLAKIQFWLAPLPQRGLKARERLTWILIWAAFAAQIYFFALLLEMAR